MIDKLTEEEFKRVIIHEFFHIIANRYYKRGVGHSKQYKDHIALYGYDRTIGDATIKRHISEPTKYKIICNDCGKILGYTNKRIK